MFITLLIFPLAYLTACPWLVMIVMSILIIAIVAPSSIAITIVLYCCDFFRALSATQDLRFRFGLRKLLRIWFMEPETSNIGYLDPPGKGSLTESF